MQIIIHLFSVVLWINLFQYCQGNSNNWKRININNEIYPWLVQIKQKVEPGVYSKVVYGTLISHNAVITTREGIIGCRLHQLIIESYCSKPNNKTTNDCFISDVATIISETTSQASEKDQDPYSILILKKSFNNSYMNPLSITNDRNIDTNNCFFTIWPSDNPSDFSTRINVNKTFHKVKISFGNPLVDTLDKNVINALSREPYLDLLRFNYLYSDDYIPRMDGVPLVCSLKNDSNQVALVGPIPGYFLKTCNKEKKNCRSIIYYINLMSYSDDVMNKLN